MEAVKSTALCGGNYGLLRPSHSGSQPGKLGSLISTPKEGRSLTEKQ